MANIENSPFEQNNFLYNKKIETEPKPKIEIGIDTEDKLYNNIIDEGSSTSIDISEIERFSTLSQNRNQLYNLIDSMAEDITISAGLEIYAEDVTQKNDKGDIVWVESSDDNISKYVTFLLNSWKVNKHIYSWVYSLCKYGDLYLKLYRKSDVSDDLFHEEDDSKQLNEDYINLDYLNKDEKEQINEDVKIVAYDKSDHYVDYIEMISNPAEIFELTKFGKTAGYIKAPITASNTITNSSWDNNSFKYRFRKNDVNLYQPTEFVHASLQDDVSRYPEQVDIFIDNNADMSNSTADYSYTVNRGQSLLYNLFKVWRQLSLLENSVLLNRLTKSSITRIIGVEVGDMPKENVPVHLMGVKRLIEQKSAINEAISMSEYTNPGPIDNTVYVPTHKGIGAITSQQIGGDVDVKSLADLDYYKNKLYSGLRIPKQYLGDTDDATGFNGGTSLTIISSRYAKTIQRIQTSITQMLTDAINLYLLDRNLSNYINKFTLQMQVPTTQEELDRRDNMASKVQIVSDIMSLLADIEDQASKLKILKNLLSTIISDNEIMSLLQDEIDKLESELDENVDENVDEGFEEEDVDLGEFSSDRGPSGPRPSGGESPSSLNDIGMGSSEPAGEEEEPQGENTGETVSLPNMNDIGLDFTDSNNF